MCATVAAVYLYAAHEEAVVRFRPDVLADGWLPKARPSGAGVELGVGREEWRAATDAGVDTVHGLMHVCAAEWSLGRMLARHAVLLWGELLRPLLVGLHSRFR